MDSWWQLGEWSGYSGKNLDTQKLVCAFCDERGNFELKHHEEKKKPNSSKKINFDTYKCVNCAGFLLVVWSGSEYDLGEGLHGIRAIPHSLKVQRAPEYWPERLQNFWLQAKTNLTGENWDAAAVMARSALQFILRDKGAVGRTLKNEIDDLASKGILPPIIKDWSDNVRELGNDAAHPSVASEMTSKKDAVDVVRFLDFLIQYLYQLPKEINDFRARKSE